MRIYAQGLDTSFTYTNDFLSLLWEGLRCSSAGKSTVGERTAGAATPIDPPASERYTRGVETRPIRPLLKGLSHARQRVSAAWRALH